MMWPQLSFAKLEGFPQHSLGVLIAPQVDEESSQIPKSLGCFGMLISRSRLQNHSRSTTKGFCFLITTQVRVECSKIVKACGHIEMTGPKDPFRNCQRPQRERFGVLETTLFRIQSRQIVQHSCEVPIIEPR